MVTMAREVGLGYAHICATLWWDQALLPRSNSMDMMTTEEVCLIVLGQLGAQESGKL